MRILLFFDLPVLTSDNRKDYRHFRKYLIKNGFLMLQESVYSKLAMNSTSADTIIENVKRNKPSAGKVQILKITEKQYSKMGYIVGDKSNNIIDSDERLLVL